MVRSRATILQEIRCEFNQTDRTEILIDWIQELWETLDILAEMYGQEKAREIIDAPISSQERQGVFS